MAGRYKLHSDGTAYYDPNDTGPNQASPEQIAALQGPGSAPPSPPQGPFTSPYADDFSPRNPDGSKSTELPLGTGKPWTNMPTPGAPIGDVFADDGPRKPWTSMPTPVGPPNRVGIDGTPFYDPGYRTGSAESGASTITNPAPWTGGYTGGGTNPNILTNMPTSPAPTGTKQAPAPSGPTSYQYMEGVDTNKLNDPTHTTPKYVASRILASGGSLQQAAQAIGATVLDATRMRLPSGEVIDTRRDEEGANALQWLVLGGDTGGGSQGLTGPSGATSVMGSTLGGQQGASGVQGSSFNDQVRQLLMQQLGGSMGPVSGSDPQIKAEMDAQEAMLERQRRQRRSSDAERAAMQGLLNGGQSSGSFDASVASGFEDKGQALAGIQAQLFTRELQSRRTHVATLLNMALQSGDNEQARNLQFVLAQMDDQIRRMTLRQNQDQWNDEFGLRAGRFQYEKDRDLAGYGGGF